MAQEFWTEEQTKILIDSYGKIKVPEIAKILCKTYSQTNSKIRRLREKGLLNKPIDRGETKDYSADLIRKDLASQSNYKTNTKYEVQLRVDAKNKFEGTFVGFLVQETKDHITLRCKSGYCQSFLKVDLLRGEHPIREVN